MSEAEAVVVPVEKLPEWREKFRFYRQPPDEARIADWLRNFDEADLAVAAKLLDHVTVIGEPDVQRGYRAALAALDGWSMDETARRGRWFFVGFGRASESGPAMLRMFREANDLAYARYDSLFQSLSDLPGLKLTANDTVVFVDDFSGSGRQVKKMWPIIAEMVASEATCYLVLTALTTKALGEIRANTSLRIHATFVLGPEHLLFHEENSDFTEEEKDVVHRYCEVADPRTPKGVGGLGVMFVLHHKSANNCLPILYVNEPRWRGLFPRYLRA